VSPRIRRALCLAFGAALLIPGAAQAAEKSVSMGIPQPSQKSFQSTGSDVNAFFPNRVSIHAGDTVRFVPSGFHTVDLPGNRNRRLPIIVPTGQPIAGALDPAGAPFWFNGQGGLGFNPPLFKSGFGKRFSYTGNKAVLSGAPVSERPKAMTVRFSRTGTYRYFCDIHFGMIGTVRVVGSDRRVPSTRADSAGVKRQLAAALRTAKSLGRTKAPANTVDVGVGGKGNVSLLAFVPATLTVPTGTTVNFRIASRTEIHTATIGPGDPEKEPNSVLGMLAGSLNSPVPNPAALLPSDPPGVAALTPTAHGVGLWNSGVLDEDPSTALGTSNSVRFAAPGVYQVYCMIHPFMHGTVTVQ